MSEKQASASARRIAADAVATALAGEGYLSRKLAEPGARLDTRDAALAREIAFGAVRHIVTIETLLQRFARYDPRRTATSLRAILACAVFQIVWMPGVPVFAAVDEAVSLARAPRAGGAKAAGMVNAVLRRISEQIAERDATWNDGARDCTRTGWLRACRFASALVDASGKEAELHRLALLVGERPARLRQLIARFGKRNALPAAWASQAVPPTTLYPNTLRMDAATFAQRIASEFGDCAAVLENGGAVIAAGARVGDSALLREGFAYVQDPTAHAAAELLNAAPGEHILDLCAAPGGKTIALALAMGGAGKIVACDVDERRLARVTENVARLGIANVETKLLTGDDERRAGQDALAAMQSSDTGSADSDAHAGFDAVLVDVPCSNTGVIARRPEARLRHSARKLASLTQLQTRLLQAAANATRAGGRIVYSTCSIEREENEDIVLAFIAANPGWNVASLTLTLPHWGERVAEWRDGGFAALLRR